jgi:uncharacterized membrane protein YqiK
MNGSDIIAIVILVAIVIAIAVYLLHWLYRRSTKDVSFVRTGLGGEKVVMGGGALVLPVLHDVTPVSMNTLRLEVRRGREQALITRDRMRIDVTVEFFVRVMPKEESVAAAARTLGQRTMNPESLKDLVQGRFVDAMGLVAAKMSMEEIHEHRGQYISEVREQVAGAMTHNGLELEAASLTSLDQTDMKLFNPSNAFDAEGLTRLTEEIESRKKKRNDIEQDTAVAMRRKNLESEQLTLCIARDSEYSRLEQEREVAVRRAQQRAEIALEKAERERETEEAQIRAVEEVEKARIRQERAIEAARIERQLEVERLELKRRRDVEIEDQERMTAVSEKSKTQAEAQAIADGANAQAVAAREKVTSVREREIAERRKMIELLQAEQEAECEAIKLRTVAVAERQAAAERAAAERLMAEAAQVRYAVDAEGQRALNEAENMRSDASRRSGLYRKLLENLPDIIRESAKPMERIDSIKILQVQGMPGLNGAGGGSGPDGASEGGGSLADHAVNAALRYRVQAPFVEEMLSQIGIAPGSVSTLGNLMHGEGKGLADIVTANQLGNLTQGPASDGEPKSRQ